MKVTTLMGIAMLTLTAATAFAGKQLAPAISGDYLEVRSCDVYTGSCVANAEMGLSGKEGILVWSIREGSWNGTSLDGLGVIAVVRADGTLGDLRYEPRRGKAIVIVDAKASTPQKEALAHFARAMAGALISEVVEVKSSNMELTLGNCTEAGCASVKAGSLVQVSTRCLGGKDHLCGNEEIYYPPLTKIDRALPVMAESASYKGNGLGMTWETVEKRSAFLGGFSL